METDEKVMDNPLAAVKAAGPPVNGVWLFFDDMAVKKGTKGYIVALPLDQADQLCRAMAQAIIEVKYKGKADA